MLRIIHQERNYTTAWQAFLGGAGKAKETFTQYLRRMGITTITPVDDVVARAEAERTIASVREKLGALYRPPIRA